MTDTTFTSFKRNFLLGSTATGRVWVTVEFDVNGRLSFTGEIGPRRDGNCSGNAGQIVTDLTEIGRFADGWDAAHVYRLVEVWREWHLNDVRAECEHQRKLGWTWTTHPADQCPECGYRLGSAWLRVEVPEDVLEWVKGLPVATVEHPWETRR